MIGRPQAHRAFTLAELLVVTTIAIVAASLALPQLTNEDRVRLIAASAVVASDIETAQMLTIASPDQPVLVKFDPDGNKYWLAYVAGPDTPITRPDTGEPYLVILGYGRAAGADGVVLTVSDLPSNQLEFDAQGAVSDFSLSPSITLRRDTIWIRLDVQTTTGMVSEVEGEDEE